MSTKTVAVATLAGAEVLAHANMECENGGEAVEDGDEVTYYVDGAGNYHFQPLFSSSKDVLVVSSEAPEELKKIAPATNKKRTAALKTRSSSGQSATRVEKPKEEENDEEINGEPVAVNGLKKAHSENRPFKCSVCDRGFLRNASLLNHANTHNLNKPHACSSCESVFTTNGALLRHIRYRHTGEKPHKCTECDHSSVEICKLRHHMSSHTGERTYQCPHCTYASIDNSKLQRHMRTHTGERPYACDICQARFTQSNSLKVHRHIHSVDKPLACQYCTHSFSTRQQLKRHMSVHHKVEYKSNLMQHKEQHEPKSNTPPEKLTLNMGRLTRAVAKESVVPVAIDKSRSRSVQLEAVDDEIKAESEVDENDENDNELFSVEDYGVNETLDEILEEEKVDQKPLIISVKPTAITKTEESRSHSPAPQIKTVSIKQESEDTEFISAEAIDSQEFVMKYEVEEQVEGGADDSYAAIGNVNQMPMAGPSTAKTELESCFGFVVYEYVDDPDTKETIQLMDIIEED